MLGWPTTRKSSRYLDTDELYDQIDSMRDTIGELTRAFGKSASRRAGEARSYASHAADDAEELMKDHLAASMLMAVGIGVVVGYFLRRGTE
jgi:ElaB/YqjD/DUF883 family membrane-anchored ribosome-binding protein